jgi:hypothetical protein
VSEDGSFRERVGVAEIKAAPTPAWQSQRAIGRPVASESEAAQPRPSWRDTPDHLPGPTRYIRCN